MEIYACNYADDKYKSQQKLNTKTALSIGKVKKVFVYGPEDLDLSFRKKHKKILSYRRGGGLWLWKPYIILKTLETIRDDDWLFYADSGSIYVNEVSKLVNAVSTTTSSDVFCFEIPLKNRQFCKRETFERLSMYDENQNQILSGFILLRNSTESRNFIKEWLEIMTDEISLSPNHFTEVREFDDFIAHREDQSLLSLLCYKKKLMVYRDPSDYGDRPYMLARSPFIYAPRKYSNSTYPKIVISNRYHNPLKYYWREKLLTMLHFVCPSMMEKIVLRMRKVNKVEKQ